jgi:hypothetical protein
MTVLHVLKPGGRLTTRTCVSLTRCIPGQSRVVEISQKGHEKWKLPNDFWITVEKGVLSYTENPKKAKDMPYRADGIQQPEKHTKSRIPSPIQDGKKFARAGCQGNGCFS